METRLELLDTIKQAREGSVRVGRNKLDFAEHVMRIPEQDYYALLKIFPHLNSRNAQEQRAEWERFFASDFSLAYRVARTPLQVRRAPRSVPT